MFANHQRAALRVLTLGVSLLATAGVAAAQIAVAESDALLTEAERAEAARLLPLMDAALSG